MANIQQQAPAFNPITDQNQEYLMAQLKAQRAQQMAQMLTEQGASPIQYDQRGAISKGQMLSKVLQAYMGGQMTNDAMQQQVDARAMGAKMMGQAYGMPPAGGSGSASPAPAAMPPQAAQPPMAASQGVQPGQTAPLNPYGAPPALVMMAAQGDPAAKAQLETFLKTQDLTNEQKNSRDPMIGASVARNLQTQNMPEISRLQLARKLAPEGSPQAQQLDEAIAKANYIAPAEIKQGNVALDRGNNPIFYNPKTADGIVPMFQTAGGVTAPTGARALPGYAGANASIQGAEQGAKQANTVFTGVQGPDGAPMAGYGSNLFGGAGGAPSEAQGATWTGGQLSPQQLQNLHSAAQGGNQNAKAVLDAYGQAAGAPAQRPGVVTGADPTIQTARTNQQTGMAEKWKPLNEAVSNAQTVNSRLDTIKDLATRASTGQFSDRMQYVNSLLSLAGSEKATDDITAKVLLDKNAAQIAVGLGGKSDASDRLIQSAYPNSHMPKEAITEASDNLKAANQMQVAKASLLQKHYLANDPAAYQKAEQAFNEAADPRIYQWKAMAGNPQAQAAYAKKLMAQDPQIAERIRALDQMGALK